MLNFLVESFGLHNNLFPFPSILDTDYPVFIFYRQMSYLMLFLCTRFHLHPLNLLVPILRWEFLACKCFPWTGSWPFAQPPTWRTRWFFQSFLPLAFTDPSLNRKAALLVLVCPGYFISPVLSISGKHSPICHPGRHPMGQQHHNKSKRQEASPVQFLHSPVTSSLSSPNTPIYSLL